MKENMMLYYLADENNGRLSEDMSYGEVETLYLDEVSKGVERELDAAPEDTPWLDILNRVSVFYSIEESEDVEV